MEVRNVLFHSQTIPIKAFNVMVYNGCVMSMSYRIEAQLNKKVSKITLRKTSLFFFFGYQRDPISLLEATVILRKATEIHVVFGNNITLGETFFCTFKNRVEDGKRDVTVFYCVFRPSCSRLETTLSTLLRRLQLRCNDDYFVKSNNVKTTKRK